MPVTKHESAQARLINREPELAEEVMREIDGINHFEEEHGKNKKHIGAGL